MGNDDHYWVVLTQSVYLFIPMLLANQGPGLAQKMRLPFSAMPVSVRLLGPNKTVAAYYAGPALGLLGTYLLVYPNALFYGLLFGLAAVVGDHAKSYYKRSRGYPPGAKFFLDRIDYAVGGCFVAWILLPITWEHVAVIVTAAWIVHVAGNNISYKLGWRKTPH